MRCWILSEELAGDVWRLGLLRRDGGRQRLDLTVISQPWLREIYRDWAREALAGRHLDYLRSTLCQFRRLSESLRTRHDGGMDRAAVGRRDIENFLMRLAGHGVHGGGRDQRPGRLRHDGPVSAAPRA